MVQRGVKHRSAIIFELGASVECRVEQLFHSYTWSVEIWRPEMCLNTRKCLDSIDSENNYIIVQSNDSERKAKEQLERFLSVLMENKKKFLRSSNICTVKIIPSNFSDDLIQLKHSSNDKRCILRPIMKGIGATVLNGVEALLHAAGVTSTPFAYYDATERTTKGLDISLIDAAANKLDLPIIVEVIDVDKFRNFNASSTSAGEFTEKRWKIITSRE